MRKFLPLIVVGILVLGGLGAVAAKNESYTAEKYEIVFSQPIIQNDEEFLTISIEEANSQLMEQGKPMLPSYTRSFAFPFGTKIKSVTCTPTNIEMKTILKDITPTPAISVVGQQVSTSQKVTFDSDVVSYPSDWFDYDVSGGLDDGKLSVIVNVQINLVKYYPLDKKIESAKDFSIIISYEPTDEPISTRQEYEFLIIAPDEFSDELASFVTHKTNRGITTKFVGLNEVNNNPNGRDTQEKIKYYLKDAIEDWGTTSVLLVGSATKLATREVHVNIEEQNDKEVFVSDLYYADIFTGTGSFDDWDSNGNGIFAEYDWYGEDDDVDMVPDLYFGRWACRDGTEVTACVNKAKNYENNEAYKQDWFLNFVGVGGDSFEDDHDVLEGEYIGDKVADLMTSFIPNFLWVTNGKLSGAFPTGVQNIKDAINDGCGFVDFSGHGNTNIWATHPHMAFTQWLPTPLGGIRSNDISTLSNNDKLPIVTVEACSTAKFKSDSNCYNWAFMYNANGGAIATFGATGLGYGSGGSSVASVCIGKMGIDTYKAYKTDEAESLGEMWVKGLDRYTPTNPDGYDWKTIMEWQVFGDPTLQIAEESNPPAKPAIPAGPTNAGKGQELTYSTITTDPEDDDIYYMFDWGDSTTSGWVGPFDSGASATAKKTWTDEGTYNIKVVAKDDHGKLSDWSDELAISIPRSKSIIPEVDGTFSAQLGLKDQDPVIFLEGSYITKEKFKGVWGTATIKDNQGTFKGYFKGNYLIVKFSAESKSYFILGKISFNENEFTGNWIGKKPYAKGWIEGEFIPS